MPRGRRIKNAIKKIGNAAGKVLSVAKAPAKEVLNSLMPVIKQQINSQIAKAITGAGQIGLPFRESGMMASATPVSSSGGIQVSAPSANGRITRTSGPRQRSRPNGNATVTHREYITDINLTEQGFDLQFRFGVNPGNPSLFPWLSQIASRYELYSFRSLRFVYEPQCGTSSNGTVFMAIDFDASDSPPENKTQMMSYKNAVRSPLWFASEYNTASQDLHRLKTNYVLSGVAPPNTDIKTYDIGNLYVAIQSDSSTDQTAGELYVEYTVDLIAPQINNDALSGAMLDRGWSNDRAPFSTTATSSIPYQTRGDLLLLVEQESGNADLFNLFIGQAGYYQVECITYGTFNTPATSLNNIFQSYQGTGGLLMNNTSNLNIGESVTICQLQVINPEQPAAVINWTNWQEAPAASAADNSITLVVTPISQSCLLQFNALSFVPVTQNPRARLGRIRPYPAT